VVDDPHDLVRLNAIEAIGNLGDRSAISLLQSFSQQTGKMRDYAQAAIAGIEERRL
jgi:HEAT repeat protein